jgi:branched-chain amino acid transport system substrate-binding protein
VKLTVGLSLSLSGEYAAMGRQAEAGVRLLVSDVNSAGGVRVGGRKRELELVIHDDASSRARCAEIYRRLCAERPVDLLLGPYASALVRAAAPVADDAGRVLVNHGGAADDLYRRGHRMIVGVLSCASDYFTGLARLLATLKFWRKRVALVCAPTAFAREVQDGFERACTERTIRRRGVRIRLKYRGRFDLDRTPELLLPALRRNRINVLASVGPYEHDIDVMHAVTAAGANLPVLACVAAGLGSFGAELGDNADGILGPSQWEDQLDIDPEIGPTPREFVRRMRAAGFGSRCEYPAAQAYTAGLLGLAGLREIGTTDQAQLRAALGGLRTSTFFGNFEIDPATGRQVGHKVLLVQWHRGRKVIIEPEVKADHGELEFPTGWRLLLSGWQMLKLKRREAEGYDTDDEDGRGER